MCKMIMQKITVRSEVVKWFALFSMTMDHLDQFLLHTGWISNTIGRMAFPIFAYLFITHFSVFHNAKKYLLRLSVFGVLTQILLWPYGIRNVLFSFLCVLLFLLFVEKLWQKTNSQLLRGYFSFLGFLVMLPIVSCVDYGISGFLFMVALYAYLHNKTKLNYVLVLVFSVLMNDHSITSAVFSLCTVFALLSVVSIQNSKRFMRWWFFYVYYPLHRWVLYFFKGLFES